MAIDRSTASGTQDATGPPLTAPSVSTAATWWFARRSLARQRLSVTLVAIVVAAGASATIVAAGAAHRTATAFARYAERAEVADLVVNPAFPTGEIDAVIRGAPGLSAVSTDSLFTALVADRGAPRTFWSGWRPVDSMLAPGSPDEVWGSHDGRFVAMDRPVFSEGRAPTGQSEAMVSVRLAERLDLELGDRVPVSFWGPLDEQARREAEHNQSFEVISEPIGVEELTIVGIATFADQVLPDELFRGGRMVVSPDVARRYDCLAAVPSPDADPAEVRAAIHPPGCARAYRYWSMEFGSAPAATAALESLRRDVDRLADALPSNLDDDDLGLGVFPTTRGETQQRVERAGQPIVVGLAVLALAAGVVTVLVGALAAARAMRAGDGDQRLWWQLGLGRRASASLAAMAPLVGTAVGVTVAAALAWWWSPIAPVGAARALEPSPSRELTWVTGAIAGCLAVTLGLVVVWLAVRAARRAVDGSPASGVRVAQAGGDPLGRFARSGAPPEAVIGLRAASARGGARLVLGSVTVAVAIFVSAIVFGASLGRLLTTPAWYGWPWDRAVLLGFGYGSLGIDPRTESLRAIDGVEGWTALGITADLTVNGAAVVSIVGFPGATSDGPETDVTVVRGELPTRNGEVAIGERVARSLGIDVGDDVIVAVPPRGLSATMLGEGSAAEFSAQVTGVFVFPALGQFSADRAAPGDGLMLTVDSLSAKAVELFSFVGIDTEPGVDADRVFAEVAEITSAWDYLGDPLLYDGPVRPAEIVDARPMRTAVRLVAVVVAFATVIGLWIALGLSVRQRAREFGALRALGFTTRQLRTTIGVQSLAVIVVGLAVGVPVGIVVGRVTWRAFASELGVVTTPTTTFPMIALVCAGALVSAFVAAVLPAHRTGATRPTDSGRSD